MKDLVSHEVDQLADEIGAFVKDMALVGLKCVVIVHGRGISRVGYSKDTAPDVPVMLAAAYDSATKYNARQAN